MGLDSPGPSTTPVPEPNPNQEETRLAARIEAAEQDERRKTKVRASVKRLCGFCKVVKRRGIVFIHCTANPKHKQRQGFSTIAEAAAAASCLPTPPPPASTSAFAEASKLAKQEMSTKFNWPLGLAALLKSADK